MDNYVKGLLTAYERVINLIDAIDPEHVDISLECIRSRIDASIYAYKLFSSNEDLVEYELSKSISNKALEGSLRKEDLDSFLIQLTHKKPRCKIISLPDNYFTNDSVSDD